MNARPLRWHCIVCARPKESEDSACLHGAGPPLERFTGGLDLTVEQLADKYNQTLEQAAEIYEDAHGHGAEAECRCL